MISAVVRPTIYVSISLTTMMAWAPFRAPDRISHPIAFTGNILIRSLPSFKPMAAILATMADRADGPPTGQGSRSPSYARRNPGTASVLALEADDLYPLRAGCARGDRRIQGFLVRTLWRLGAARARRFRRLPHRRPARLARRSRPGLPFRCAAEDADGNRRRHDRVHALDLSAAIRPPALAPRIPARRRRLSPVHLNDARALSRDPARDCRDEFRASARDP